MIISDGKKIKAYNYSADTLYSGKIVLVKGKNASLANPSNSSDNIQYLLGMCIDTIYPATYGEVLLEGTVSKVNTSNYANTTILYLGTEGSFTSTVPTVFSETVVIGHVLVSDIEGQIYFKAVPSVQSPTQWGTITGDINNQDDLIDLLDGKFDNPTGTTSQYIRGDGTLATLPTGGGTWGQITGTLSSQGDLNTALNAKQDTLVSGNNIKTINNSSILGFGNLTVSGVPAGGNAGDILAKNSATDYDAGWIENYTSSVKHTVKLAESINKGQAVYVSSADGTNIKVSKASNASEATSSKTMGLLAFTGATNDIGFVVTEGLLAGLDTSTAGNAGDPVWLGANGDLIYGLANKPSAPQHLVFIGIVTRKQSQNGEIFVKVQNGFEIEELHNVSAKTPNGGDTLIFNKDTNLWESKAVVVPAGMTWMGAFPG